MCGYPLIEDVRAKTYASCGITFGSVADNNPAGKATPCAKRAVAPAAVDRAAGYPGRRMEAKPRDAVCGTGNMHCIARSSALVHRRYRSI